jgi:hypothetical protein
MVSFSFMSGEPASSPRFGPSQIVDPHRYQWTAAPPRRLSIAGQIVYEMHIGTFTRDGTWAGAIDRLPRLADTGITMAEIMPVAEFPGRFGWGYDGVFPFAPTRLYGSPDDFRAFVDAAHALGLAVVLDVVYNHLGPDGSVFARYAKSDRAFSQQQSGSVDGAVLGPDAFLLRYSTERAEDERLVIVNLGAGIDAGAFPEALTAPPSGCTGWSVHWSSEHPDYGGIGTPEVAGERGWRIPGHSTVGLRPSRARDGAQA